MIKKTNHKKIYKKNKLFYAGIMMTILTLSVIHAKNNDEIIFTSNDSLSNKKICWGIKRNENHEQPDLGSKNLELINENGDIAIGNSEDKYVYLTFDNGYEAGYTSQILDILKENDTKAAFFITGHYLNTRARVSKKNDR